MVLLRVECNLSFQPVGGIAKFWYHNWCSSSSSVFRIKQVVFLRPSSAIQPQAWAYWNIAFEEHRDNILRGLVFWYVRERLLTLRILLHFARKTGGHFFLPSDPLLVGMFKVFSFYFYTTEFHQGLVSVKLSIFFYMLQLWSFCSRPSSLIFPVVDVIWLMWLVSNSEIEYEVCKEEVTWGKP